MTVSGRVNSEVDVEDVIVYAGEKLLGGAEYGVEIVELNPPLILWVAGVMAALALLLGSPVMLLTMAPGVDPPARIE